MEKKAKNKPSKDLTRLAKRIKELRIQKGYSSYEYFAYENEISRAQYGRYEKGEDMRYSSLLKVIKALGVSVKEFFSEGFEEGK
jgi:transcriptional regulator with XRE-family HTH domain